MRCVSGEEIAKRDVLPRETLVDILNLLTRVELDGWNTVSRKFHASTQCAQPLRPVFSAVLMYYRASNWSEKLYEAVFYVVNGGPAKVRQCELNVRTTPTRNHGASPRMDW